MPNWLYVILLLIGVGIAVWISSKEKKIRKKEGWDKPDHWTKEEKTIKCPYCNKVISKDANRCIHCEKFLVGSKSPQKTPTENEEACEKGGAMEEKICPACGFKNSSFFLMNCEKCDCPLEAKPTQEESSVYKEVAKRRKRAEDLGLPELFGKMYHNTIKHYPSWIKGKNKLVSVCSLVTEAQEIGENKMKIKLNGREYIFEFKKSDFSTPDDEFCSNGHLILYSDDKKVLDISMHINHSYENEYSVPEWGLFEAQTFIEGDWIKDFKELEKRIPLDNAERERKQAEKENSEKVKKLKEDFDIE